MAKMKVHELAKELEIQSKDIITYLKEKGMEVKAAQSSIEDEAIDLVRGRFKKEDKGQKQVEKAEKTMEAGVEKRVSAENVTGEKPAPEKKASGERQAGNRPAEGRTKAEEPVRKKKKIIIINNSGNSKMQGNRGNDRNAAGRGIRDNREGRDNKRPASQGQ